MAIVTVLFQIPSYLICPLCSAQFPVRFTLILQGQNRNAQSMVADKSSMVAYGNRLFPGSIWQTFLKISHNLNFDVINAQFAKMRSNPFRRRECYVSNNAIWETLLNLVCT